MVRRCSIEVDCLVGREVRYRLLHVVIVNYLRLARELTIMMERPRSLLELLRNLKLRVSLPVWLILQKDLLFSSTLSSSLLFWWLCCSFIDVYRLIILIFQSKHILASSPSSYCDYIILTTLSRSIQTSFTFLIKLQKQTAVFMHILLLFKQIFDLCLADIECDGFSIVLVGLCVLNQILFHRVVFIFFTVIVRTKELVNTQVMVEVRLR